ncbi:unnamed protein product [Brassica napus]|uniref:(rape) hypothetical protein n=1 Tax=Brassica napus TaxID=3708 RepID=A0A816IP44_BRANA|nr:unnamed protein product [Brassica napus]
MAPLMCSSPPPRLRLPSFPPQLRPLVDPPPCTPLHLPLEAPSLLEPSDPPDSPFHLKTKRFGKGLKRGNGEAKPGSVLREP